tara:strand:+ start:632 stop:1225 length:594 start_codon:yes stop_codon:yes gene_type:complete
MIRTYIQRILFLFFLFPISIAEAQNPVKFIEEVTLEASLILKKNISKEQKMQLLVNLAEGSVDIKGIGRYSLGKHRKNISDEELEKYEKLFYNYFLKSFSSRLSEYTDPKINVLSQQYLNEKYTIVSSVLVGDENRPEIKIDWRVYTKNPNQPLIRDLIIEGLSLARTQKEEFNSVIQSADGDVNVLFENLKKFNNS